MGIIAKQSIKGTIVTYIGVAIGFFTTFFVLTRFLTAEEIGLSRVLVDAATLFIGLAQMGSASSIIRFYPYFKDPQKQDNGFFFWTAIVPLIGFIVVSILFFALQSHISSWFAEKSPLFVNYYYFVLPLSFFMLYQTIAETDANVKMKIVFPRAVREVLVRILMLCVYLLYAFRVISIDGFVIAICVAYAVAALANCIYLVVCCRVSFKPNWQFPSRQLVRQYLAYTLFLILTALSTVLAPSLSSFFVTAKLGLNFTGIFAIATYMAMVVSIPYRSLNAIASPQVANAIKQKDIKQVQHLGQQVANNLSLVGAFILAAIWINIDLIFAVLPNGSQYAQAKYVVLILGISQLLLATFNISTTTLNFSNHYYYSLVYSFVLTILSIFLNNCFIPLWGINGAALANLVAYIIYFVFILATVKLKTHTTVLSANMLKTLVLVSMIFAVNFICLTFQPVALDYMASIIVSSVVRTVFIWLVALVVAYKWNISSDINKIIDSFIRKFH